jgi:hypothetical protein
MYVCIRFGSDRDIDVDDDDVEFIVQPSPSDGCKVRVR